MGARARQQWRYGNYRIHPSRASHLATLGDYGVIESRSEAFGDGFLSVAALWINLGKRGQKKSGLSFQSPEEHLREAGMCIQERVAYCRVGQTPRREPQKLWNSKKERRCVRTMPSSVIELKKRIRPSALYWSKIIKAGALIGDTKTLLSWS